jgi:pantetheine-phosphate adenylyltransferase
MRVCIGGTFNILHKGHKHLIDKAFQTAGKNGFVTIGLTEGKMLQKKKFVKPFEEREKAINSYLSSKGYDRRAMILSIYDKYGYAVDGDFDAIVVSPETFKNAEEINKNRLNKGKKALLIIEIPFVLANDKKPISSTRIYDSIIDENGQMK